MRGSQGTFFPAIKAQFGIRVSKYCFRKPFSPDNNHRQAVDCMRSPFPGRLFSSNPIAKSFVDWRDKKSAAGKASNNRASFCLCSKQSERLWDVRLFLFQARRIVS